MSREPGASAPRPATRIRRFALAVLLAPLAGCSLERIAADQMVPVLQRTRDLVNQEPVPRAAREAGPGLLVTLEGIVATSPENVELRLLQAELAATFAFAFLEEEDPAWARALYRKARGAALAALAEEEEELAGALAADRPVGPLLAEADEDALPALFWWAFARGAEINLDKGDPAKVAGLTRVDEVMGWVLARDERFYHGGPQLYFAMRRAALAPTFGGDPVKAAEHFDAVDRITGKRFLLPAVLRAKFLAPSLAATPAGAGATEALAAQQRAWDAYYGGLKAVLAAPDDLFPEQALANAVAKERARRLLAAPEDNNIIPPPGAVNEFASPGDEPGDSAGWDDGGD